MKRIVLVNAHWNNRGDEAAIRAVIDCILGEVSDIEIEIVFKDKGEIYQFPYVGQVKYITSRFLPKEWEYMLAIMSNGKIAFTKELKKTIEAVKNADMLIYAPGGAVISDRFWWRKQLEYLFPIAYAEKRKIPVIFAAPSLGPFSKKKSYRNKILKKVDKICVREEISKEELKNQGIVDNVLVTVDSAFLNGINIENNMKKLKNDESLYSFMNKFEKIVGITISDLSWHVEYRKMKEMGRNIRDAFSGFIERLRMQGTGVLLIPQLFGNQNDRDYLKTYVREGMYLLDSNEDTYYQQFIISRLYAVVGMRYHSNIFAAKTAVPFVPIVYEEKMAGFIRKAGYEDMAINVSELSADKLSEKYQKLMAEYDTIKNSLKEKGADWKSSAEQTKREIMKGINKIK